MQNLRRHIIDEKDYMWCTRKEWTRFICTGNCGQYAAVQIPTAADFSDRLVLIESAFPLEWEKKLLVNIPMPEKFDPIAPRD
jgi:hypothetical protein